MAYQVELACPYCAGVFPAEVAVESRPATCLHCARTVTVPAAPIQPVPPVPPTPAAAKSPSASPAGASSPFEVVETARVLVNRRGEEVPLRRLSPSERVRYRRRLNLVFALAGLVILSFALVVLLRFGP